MYDQQTPVLLLTRTGFKIALVPADANSQYELGLTSTEAYARLRANGPNRVSVLPSHRTFAFLLPLVANPLVLVLLIAAAVSAAVGDHLNAAIIAVVVSISFVLDGLQTHRSAKAAEQLRNSIAPTSTVRRDGQWIILPQEEIVVGDMIRLSAGDLVPADGCLLTEKDLHVNEAALTGESMPFEKETGQTDERSRVFLGTSVVSGTATMRAEQAGADTAFAAIAKRLRTPAPETEFERGIRGFGRFISRLVALLTGIVLVSMLALHRPPLQAFMFAIALAVGLTPEFMPMITTVTLGRSALRMAKRQVIVKNLAAIQNFGSMDVLCSDKTGTLTSGVMSLERTVEFEGRPKGETLKWAALNATYQSGISSPLDQAILGVAKADLDWIKVDEVPFDFTRRLLSVVVESDQGRFLVSKGSPEGILQRCSLQDGEREKLLATADREGEQGYRVLAVAIKEVPVKAAYGTEDESGLSAIGLLAFADPPLADALQTVKRLRAAGIELKVITGDSEVVARHVCEGIGIDPGRILLGSEIEQMTDDALQATAEKTLLFARTSPIQKNRIISALKARGHVVGYMGDGINDAPSLHTADVGISFADGTDVAKDAAQIILVQRHLKLLLDGVYEGRMAFGNIMKYLFMGTSSSFGNMLSMAGAAIFLPFLPMLPSQLLLNNLLYDVSQIPIPTDRVDDSYVRKPKRWDIRAVRNFMLVAGPISSLYDAFTFWVLLHIFRADEKAFHTGWFVESLFTQVLVIFVIRTRFRPWRSRPSRALLASALAVAAIAVFLPLSPVAADLGFVPLSGAYYLFVLAATLTYLGLVELAKRWLFADEMTKEPPVEAFAASSST